MESAELNRRIEELEESDPKPFIAFGGKAIPYIGSFWRQFDFDTHSPTLGVIPPGPEELDPQREHPALVGFMVNNKWDYPRIGLSAEEWAELRRLLEEAVTVHSRVALKAFNDYVQAFANKWEFVPETHWRAHPKEATIGESKKGLDAEAGSGPLPGQAGAAPMISGR